MVFEAIAVDAVGDDVADEDVVAILRRELIGGVIGDARDGGAAMVVRQHLRPEAQAVVRFAEAGVIGSLEKLIDRPAVAVARIEVAERIERKPERIDLAVRDIFDAAAVGLDAVGVARTAS